jgi:2-polyprenyl-3-methyl-5-hydroxy-6-metoxy-1,4-benzoquinol methylase
MSPFYKGGYSTIPDTYAELRKIAKLEEYRMKPILDRKSGGKLLEIGPWMGSFSSNAKEAGFDVTAIEMDQRCVDFLNTTVGVRAIQSIDPAGTLARMGEQFDVIALWHCLEHLPSPWLVLEQAARRLAPGGILLVAIPNIESYEFSLLGADWRNLDAPRHLYFFPAKLLRKLCAGFGLAALDVTTNDKLSRTFSRETWVIVARRLLPIRWFRGVLALVLGFIANRREAKENSGPGMTAIFQRSGGSA